MSQTHTTLEHGASDAGHPLDRLRPDEIDRVRVLCVAADLVAETTRFAYLGLEEPPKSDVLAWSQGLAPEPERRVRAILLDLATGRGRDIIVSLRDNAVSSIVDIDPVTDGQPPIVPDEYMLADEIVKADPGWRAAIAARGIADVDMVRACPLSAGNFALDGESGRRMLRVLSFLQNRPTDHCWAHPIDGLVAYIDPTTREVVASSPINSGIRRSAATRSVCTRRTSACCGSTPTCSPSRGRRGASAGSSSRSSSSSATTTTASTGTSTWTGRSSSR